MYNIWDELERVNRMVLPISSYPVGVRKIPDNYRYIRRSELVYPLDNGFLLDFLYSNEDGSIVTKARKYYENEQALEEGIRQLKESFAQKLNSWDTTERSNKHEA